MTAPDDPRAARLVELIEKWRAQAAEARQWAKDCADWDGANRHEFRNRAGVYETCANELAVLSGSSAAPHSSEKKDVEIMREGEDSVESTHIPTASPNESQAVEATMVLHLFKCPRHGQFTATRTVGCAAATASCSSCDAEMRQWNDVANKDGRLGPPDYPRRLRCVCKTEALCECGYKAEHHGVDGIWHTYKPRTIV